MRFEEYCLQKLLNSSTFFEIAQVFFNIRTMVASEYNVPISSIYVNNEWFKLQRQDNNFSPDDVYTVYKNSIIFEEYIHNELENAGYNYLLLVENARMYHKTLPLARAITRVFGMGSYRLVMEARDEDCVESLSKLKKIKK